MLVVLEAARTAGELTCVVQQQPDRPLPAPSQRPHHLSQPVKIVSPLRAQVNPHHSTHVIPRRALVVAAMSLIRRLAASVGVRGSAVGLHAVAVDDVVNKQGADSGPPQGRSERRSDGVGQRHLLGGQQVAVAHVARQHELRMHGQQRVDLSQPRGPSRIGQRPAHRRSALC